MLDYRETGNLNATERPQRTCRYVVDVRELRDREGVETSALERVAETFSFRSNDYYLGLIDWDDPSDPIRRLIVPREDELDAGAEGLDPSDEASNTRLPGIQHKYRDTVLVLSTDQCAGFCRYCFRKRLFLPGTREVVHDTAAAVGYVRAHPEVTDVLVSGGDPLTLPTPRLLALLGELAAIRHVRTVRIGSKMPAFNPYTILDDRELTRGLASLGLHGTRFYLMCHFDHPRELTPEAVAAVRVLARSRVTCVNQCPVSAGVNDDAEVLAELLQRTTDAGCPQYYVFQCRPTAGNTSFQVPLVRGFGLFAEARSRVSGLSRRARYCMSHATGKIEVVGVDARHVYARYHRAKDPADENRVLVLRRDDRALWFDDLVPALPA